MTDPEPGDAISSRASTEGDASKGLLARHPKLSILLIAGVFYVILFGMCAFVAVLIVRG
jgi:hypothetical protein